MRTILAKLLLWVVALGLFGGCATDMRISGVTINVTEIRPASGSSFEGQALVTLRYINESVVAIAVSESTHKLYLNGEYVGKSDTKDPVGMPRLNTATQTVAFRIENANLLSRLQGSTSPVNYRIESVLHVEAGEQYDNVKTRGTGTIEGSAIGPK